MNAHFAPLGNPALHFGLTRLAAANLGVCMNSALGSGALSAKGHAEMITRCRACPFAQACEAVLVAGEVPAECPNRGVFEGLVG